MSFFVGIQHIRVGVKFAIAGLLMIIGVAAISGAFYQTILIVEQSQATREKTRSLAENVGRLDTLLARISKTLAETEAEYRPNTFSDFVNASLRYGNAVESVLDRWPNQEERQNFNQALETQGFWKVMDTLERLSSNPDQLSVVQARDARRSLSALTDDLYITNLRLQDMVREYERQNIRAENAALSETIKLTFVALILLSFALAVALAITKYGVLDPVRRIQNTVDAVRSGDTEARTRLS
ncbi:MAG: hypothetical protein GYB21_07980, partial [Oceanospirillales bacterium]|nr:hypothetical protein [Oceanospirillales bacterium]